MQFGCYVWGYACTQPATLVAAGRSGRHKSRNYVGFRSGLSARKVRLRGGFALFVVPVSVKTETGIQKNQRGLMVFFSCCWLQFVVPGLRFFGSPMTLANYYCCTIAAGCDLRRPGKSARPLFPNCIRNERWSRGSNLIVFVDVARLRFSGLVAWSGLMRR